MSKRELNIFKLLSQKPWEAAQAAIDNNHDGKTLESSKAKINPCNKNKELCSIVSTRVEKMQKQLLSLNLQARIEKKHKKIFSKDQKN